MRNLYYDRDGKVITREEWASSFKEENKRVALDVVEGCTISTVWLGMDHQFGDGGPPLIFETMVFSGPLDQETVRYSTEKQALAGHVKMVNRVRQAISKIFV